MLIGEMSYVLGQLPAVAAMVTTMCLLLTNTAADQEHVQALKDFVPDHPHLHELVDKVRSGDLDAKHQYERESLSVRFNQTRERLPSDTDEEHVVLHFLDEYTASVTGDTSEHRFMNLEPFIEMLAKDDDLRRQLIEIGHMVERAECDFTCLGDHLTKFLNESLGRLMKHEEL